MRLRVMPDYSAWPIWRHDGDPYNVDPATLDISDGLRGRLLSWAAAYDATLDLDEPQSGGFGTAAAEAAFEVMGRALAVELAEELRGVASVRYWRDPR